MNNTLIKIVLAGAFTACMSALQGCATPASSSAMAVSKLEAPPRTNSALNGALQVRHVSGGKETNPLWTSQVDSDSFKIALTQSLTSAGLVGDSGVKYFVDAELQGLAQPLIGLTYDVTSTVQYSVEGNGQRKVFPVSAVGTATVSDAFLGVERLRVASERSIKENIKKFLLELSGSFAR